VGHTGVSGLARSMKLEWSNAALADLDRFAEFLNREHPSLAAIVAREIIEKTQVLSEHPRLGRQDGQSPAVLNIDRSCWKSSEQPMSFSIASTATRLVMLRVFHGREARE
jgi:plasmid stabilization system protein ParE